MPPHLNTSHPASCPQGRDHLAPQHPGQHTLRCLQPRCLPGAARGGSGGAPGLLLLPSQPCLDPRLACTGLVYLLFWDEQSSPRAKPVRIVQAKVNNDGKALFTPKQQIYIRVFTHCFPRSITCANRSLLLLYGTSVRSE